MVIRDFVYTSPIPTPSSHTQPMQRNVTQNNTAQHNMGLLPDT